MSFLIKATHTPPIRRAARAASKLLAALLLSAGGLFLLQADAATQQRRGGAKQQRRTRRSGTQPTPPAPVPAAEADTERLPPGYTGHNVGSIFLALFERRLSLAKSQFETTPDYLSRVESLVAGVRADARGSAADRLTFVPPDVKVTYDADAGTLNVKLDTESVLVPEFFMSGDWNREIGTYVSTIVVNKDRTIGSAVGQNAFGVRRRFSIRTYTTLRLALPNERISPWSGGIKLSATPYEARLMFGQVRLALTGNLAAPYLATETSRDSATITDPEEAHYFDYFLFFEPDTLAVYNAGTGEVYGTLDLTGLPRDNWKRGSTILLESRQERALREEEERREYPPEHVFTAGQVTKRAVLTSRPDPGYTEEARQSGVSGVVKLRVVLKHDGTVGDISVLSELPMGLTQRAVEAAKKLRFIPAERNGRPVSQYVTIDYNFNVY